LETGKVVFQRLIDSFDISQIVGDKIYPGAMAEERVFPAIVYSIQSNPVANKDMANIDRPRVQIDIYSQAYSEAQRLSSLCKKALEVYGDTVHEITVHWAELDSASDNFDPDLKLHHVQQGYNFITLW
jgi:hypothetical protein